MTSPWIAKFEEIEAGTPGKKPLLVGPESVTYGELFRSVRQIAGLCEAWGLSRGDRVALATADDISKIRLFFAFLRLGITSVILDPGAGRSEARTLIEAADVKAVFADRAFLDRAQVARFVPPGTLVMPVESGKKPARGGVSRFLGRRRQAGDPASFPGVLNDAGESDRLPADVAADDLAYILFTSGTTSRPKGVEITHANLFAQERTFVRQYGLDRAAEILNVLPMFHTDGLTHGPVLAFMAGATVHRPGRFQVDTLDHLLKSIYTLQITHFITVPAVLGLINNTGEEFDDTFRTPDFKFLISTAAYLDPQLWRDVEQRFGIRIVNVYGLTETVCEALYCGPDDVTRKIGTVGKPIDCEARVVDTAGNPLGVGEVGELVIKGDHVMRGYFRQPEETAEVLKDGWFHTGDLATRDEDGFYTIVGRKKNVIIRGGINVYPEDVTCVLRQIPGVLDATTFGLEHATWGERVISCIETVSEANLDVETVFAHCSEHLAREKVPNTILLMSELPRGPAGKVLLNDVKALAEERIAADSGQQLTGNIQERLFKIAAHQFKVGVDKISNASNPENTSGWNSLAHAEFLMELERNFDIRIGPRDFMSIGSVGDALKVVERKLAEQDEHVAM